MLKVRVVAAMMGAVLIWAAPVQAQDAAALGEAVFRKCKACHKIGEGAKNGVGPVLTGVVGRAAGSVEGFRYRKDLLAAGAKGLVWTEDALVQYLADPTQFLRDYLGDPKAKSGMSFKLRDEADRVNVVAYLKAAGGEAEVEAEVAPEAEPAPEMTVEEVIAAQQFDEAFLTDPANIAAGKELWFGQCTHCHGYKAYPGKAPKLKPHRYKPTFVFKRAYKGFKKMPAWREVFTVDEIRQIVAYVKSPGFAP